jgi:hypothetical protein
MKGSQSTVWMATGPAAIIKINPLSLIPHNLTQGLVNSSRLTDPGAISVFDVPVTAGPRDQVHLHTVG